MLGEATQQKRVVNAPVWEQINNSHTSPWCNTQEDSDTHIPASWTWTWEGTWTSLGDLVLMSVP